MTTEERLENLERQMCEHTHDGLSSTQISLFNTIGKIEVVSAAPAGAPTTLLGQFKIYTNGATLRFYWYDTTAATWHYVTATA